MKRHARGPVMIDVEGTKLGARDRARLLHPNTGGLILFARNFTSRAQLVDLVAEIRTLAGDILVAVDHEGGRVQRFRSDGFTHVAAMARLGELFEADIREGALNAIGVATAAGYVMAAELLACDIDLTFAPVLDLAYGPSQVIGDRAFHADARIVALLGQALTHGFALAGMANCAKHFPGHGFIAADSHHEVPVDARTLQNILADDVAPYRWLGPSIAAVMPAHVIYPEVDPAPAGFSERWLKDILRGELRFGGAIFSDDLSMQGASVAGDVSSAAVAALTAGCDMVLICNAPDKADFLLEHLEWTSAPESQARIAALKPTRRYLWGALRTDWRYQESRERLVAAGLVLN